MVVEKVIADSVRLKASVVSADEREGGLRQVLNLGHTIGHALEAETRYTQLLHGEAVAWGMIAATHIALSTGKLDSVTAGRITNSVLGFGRLPRMKLQTASILKRLRSDKKTRQGVVHFILPREIGKVEITSDVPEAIVRSAVDEIRKLARKHSGATGARPSSGGAERGRPALHRQHSYESRNKSADRGRGSCRRARPRVGGAAVREMFTSIAPRYDLLNHVLSFNIDRLWWWRTARKFDAILQRPDARVLDLCCGTGDMAFALRRRARAERSANSGRGFFSRHAAARRGEGAGEGKRRDAAAGSKPTRCGCRFPMDISIW